MGHKIDKGDAPNLFTGIYTSFKQFARIAAEECGYKPEVVGLSDQPSAVFARVGDTERQRTFGFQHTIEFREGIRMAISYLE
jgi:GDP-L-fucose synthase